MKKIYLLLFAALFFLPFSLLGKEEPKDAVLVIDTSQSMIGRDGGEDIFEDVKTRMREFVQDLRIGDSFTLLRFDTNVNVSQKEVIETEADREKIINNIATLKAKGLDTYTSLMVRKLSLYMKTLAQEQAKQKETDPALPDRLQLAVIFTDAIDDPPVQHGSDQESIDSVAGQLLTEGSDKTEDAFNSNNRFVYYFSIGNQGVNESLTQTVINSFPRAVVQQVEKSAKEGSTLAKEIREVIKNLNPVVAMADPLVRPSSTKPGEEYEETLILNANRKATGLELQIKILGEDSQNPLVSLQNDGTLHNSKITLQEGENPVKLFLKLPIRLDPKNYERKIQFTLIDEEGNPVVLAEEYSILIDAKPLSLETKLKTFPEFYIPAILLLLLTLFLLYKLFVYLSFTPILELNYWEIPEKTEENEETEEEEIFPNVIDMLEEKNGKFIISSEGDPSLFLDGLLPTEAITLMKKGKKPRKAKLLMGAPSKRKLTQKTNMKGQRLRDGAKFQIGKYGFSVHTNITK